MKKYIDIRVVGQEAELKDFMNVCKAIQKLGTVGSFGKIKVVVDGDGSGKLAFYGIGEDKNLTEFNSEGVDTDKLKEMWIGE